MFEAYIHRLFWPYFLGALVSLLTITNPVSKIPLFIELTEDLSESARAAVARKACAYGFALLTLTLFFGVFVMEVFGISLAALRVAGGLVVAVLGFRMLFGYGSRSASHRR
jgi:multiple antibiotic resistance protein